MVTAKPIKKATKPRKKVVKDANPVGRPSAMTDRVLDKLETAFKMGCTDVEACLHAGICRQTLYEYQQEHPEFIDSKEEWKQTPILNARTKVVEAVKEDTKAAQWYLERKKADEFSAKQEVQVNHTHRMDDQQLLDMFNSVATAMLPKCDDVVDAEYVEAKAIEDHNNR